MGGGGAESAEQNIELPKVGQHWCTSFQRCRGLYGKRQSRRLFQRNSSGQILVMNGEPFGDGGASLGLVRTRESAARAPASFQTGRNDSIEAKRLYSLSSQIRRGGGGWDTLRDINIIEKVRREAPLPIHSTYLSSDSTKNASVSATPFASHFGREDSPQPNQSLAKMWVEALSSLSTMCQPATPMPYPWHKTTGFCRAAVKRQSRQVCTIISSFFGKLEWKNSGGAPVR